MKSGWTDLFIGKFPALIHQGAMHAAHDDVNGKLAYCRQDSVSATRPFPGATSLALHTAAVS